MQVLEHAPLDSESAAHELSARFEGSAPDVVLRYAAQTLFPGDITLVSSFGADSVVILHMASQIDRALPVAFVDTGHLFPETIAYRDHLIERLGLTACRTVTPEPSELKADDPDNFMWAADQDSCCALRKVRPLARALEGYRAWISGRKRFQADTRKGLAIFERSGERMKINPLAAWTAKDISDYMRAWDLHPHPLVAKNFLSIGCMPCTTVVRPGEDARAGRWRGKGKVECGIHTQPLLARAEG